MQRLALLAKVRCCSSSAYNQLHCCMLTCHAACVRSLGVKGSGVAERKEREEKEEPAPAPAPQPEQRGKSGKKSKKKKKR